MTHPIHPGRKGRRSVSLLSLLAVASLLLGLVACAGPEPTTGPSPTDAPGNPTQPASPTADPSEPPATPTQPTDATPVPTQPASPTPGTPTSPPTPTPDLGSQHQYIALSANPTYPDRPATHVLDPAYVASLQRLGAALLSDLAGEDPGANQLLSPLSLSMAFSMAWMGARGETAAEMASVLQYGALSDEAILAQNRLAFESLYRNLPDLQVLLANSIWCLDDYPFEDAFLDQAVEDFYASVRAVRRAEGADPVALINQWASDNTAGKIPGILEDLDPNIVMVLLNALYFKGDWVNPFPSDATAPAPFTCPDGRIVQAATMNLRETFLLKEAKEYLAVSLPYEGGLSMVLALSGSGLGADDTLLGFLPMILGPEAWSAADLQVALPKFDFAVTMDLPDRMRSLGMEKAFLSGVADFSGMSPRAMADGMYIAKAIQKTAITVTEKGTEAAAVTAIGMGTTSMPRSIRFDRSFLFAIVDGQGVPLFVGLVADPTAG